MTKSKEQYFPKPENDKRKLIETEKEELGRIRKAQGELQERISRKRDYIEKTKKEAKPGFIDVGITREEKELEELVLRLGLLRDTEKKLF
jgi:hypothetical protein